MRVAGKGLDGLREPRRALDAENSGSTMRMLAGVLAGQRFTSTITGDDSLRKRPMRRVIEPLRQMGAEIRSHEGDRAPLEIRGGALRAIDYTPPTPSAQVKSAVLLAGLYADGVTTVREGVNTRDHTEVALREFGAVMDGGRGAIRIHPRPKLTARQLVVPSDLSTAVFLIGATLVLPGSSLMLHNVGLNPTRARVLDFFNSIGAPVRVATVQMRNGELVGDVSVRHAALEGGTISGVAGGGNDRRIADARGARPVHGKGNRDSRRARIAREGKRPHRGAGRGPAADGRARRGVSGRTASRGTLGGEVARRKGRSAGRSSHRHGAVGGGAGGRGRYDDSRCGVRRRFVSGVLSPRSISCEVRRRSSGKWRATGFVSTVNRRIHTFPGTGSSGRLVQSIVP